MSFTEGSKFQEKRENKPKQKEKMPEIGEVSFIQGMTYANIKPKDKNSKYRGKSMFLKIPKNVTQEEEKLIQKELSSLMGRILKESVYVNISIPKEKQDGK
jgi:hypothetical protein